MGNPLAVVQINRSKRTAQEWVDRGNAILAGVEPLKDGEYMHRTDVHWFLQGGRPVIGWAR